MHSASAAENLGTARNRTNVMIRCRDFRSLPTDEFGDYGESPLAAPLAAG